jgi:hypothetical protein
VRKTEMQKQYSVDREARAARRWKSRTSRTVASLRREDGTWHKLETARDVSPETAEAEVIVAALARDFKGSVNFYKTDWGGNKPHAEAVAAAEEMDEWHRRQAAEKPARDLSWSDLSALAKKSVPDSLAAWCRMKDAAQSDLEAGYRAAQVLGYHPDAWELAQFLAVRDALADEWQPRGGCESALIDMMAAAFSLWMYWTGISHERAIRTHNEQRKEVGRFESQGWKSPYQSEADAVDQAHRLSDGYNRQFLRVLRQLRDLRRYSPPVIVNNGGQVNVANQQVNVSTRADSISE